MVCLPMCLDGLSVGTAVQNNDAVAQGDALAWLNGPTGFLNRYVIEEHLAVVPSADALRGVMVLGMTKNHHGGVFAFSLLGGAMHGDPAGPGGVAVGSVQSSGGQIVAIFFVP